MIKFIICEEESPEKEPEEALRGRRGLGKTDVRSKLQERDSRWMKRDVSSGQVRQNKACEVSRGLLTLRKWLLV